MVGAISFILNRVLGYHLVRDSNRDQAKRNHTVVMRFQSRSRSACFPTKTKTHRGLLFIWCRCVTKAKNHCVIISAGLLKTTMRQKVYSIFRSYDTHCVFNFLVKFLPLPLGRGFASSNVPVAKETHICFHNLSNKKAGDITEIKLGFLSRLGCYKEKMTCFEKAPFFPTHTSSC